MDVLMSLTLAKIDERTISNRKCFADDYVARAISASKGSTSSESNCLAFFSAISGIFESFAPATVIREVLDEFIRVESQLEATLPTYISHSAHVIQVFLLGFNVLTCSSTLRKQWNYPDSSFGPDSKFGQLILSWCAASLFHDVGYEIEKCAEMELHRASRNEFWNFLTPCPIAEQLPIFLPNASAQNMLHDILFPKISAMLSNSSLTLESFERLFQRETTDFSKSVIYDHGVISALKFLYSTYERNPKLAEWAPVQSAAVAMALHNFRYKNIELNLSSLDPNALLAYLLIICDEVQEWDRERDDLDYVIMSKGEELEEDRLQILNTKLLTADFGDSVAILRIRHCLSSYASEQRSKLYYERRIKLQQLHYPVCVSFGQIRNLRTEFLNEKIGENVGNLGKFATFAEVFASPLHEDEFAEYQKSRLQVNEKPVNKATILIPNDIYDVRLLRQFDESENWYVQTTFPI